MSFVFGQQTNEQADEQVPIYIPTKIHSESEVPLPDIVRTTRDVLPGNVSKTVLFFFFDDFCNFY